MTTTCNQGHGGLKRSEKLFSGLVTYHCDACNSTNIEGTEHWVIGDLSDPAVQRWLLQFADEAMDAKAKWAEMMGSPIEDPRWEQASSW